MRLESCNLQLESPKRIVEGSLCGDVLKMLMVGGAQILQDGVGGVAREGLNAPHVDAGFAEVLNSASA